MPHLLMQRGCEEFQPDFSTDAGQRLVLALAICSLVAAEQRLTVDPQRVSQERGRTNHFNAVIVLGTSDHPNSPVRRSQPGAEFFRGVVDERPRHFFRQIYA